MIKLVVVDLDGTMYNDQYKISDKNIAAIKRLKEEGYYVAIATGRPFAGTQEAAKILNLCDENDFIITSNGAKITNAKTGEVISVTTMDINDMSFIYSESLKRDIRIHAYLEDEIFVTPDKNVYSVIYAFANKTPAVIRDFTKFDIDSKFLSVMYSVDNEDKLNQYLPIIKDVFEDKFNVARTGPFSIEFSRIGTNKGSAVKHLAKHLNLSLENVMAIGDAENDLAMLKAVKIGVAMGNAFDNVKMISDYVTLSNNESGVAHAINKFIFNE